MDNQHSKLTYHIVAAVQVFSLDRLKPIEKSPKNSNILPHVEKFMKNQNHLALEDNNSESHGESLVFKHRSKRQTVNANDAPVIHEVEPPNGPADGMRLIVRGANFGPPNVTIMVGDKPCVCNKEINSLDVFKDINGCK